MEMNIYILIFTFLSMLTSLHVHCVTTDIQAVLKKMLEDVYEKSATAMCTKVSVADWDHSTDLANETKAVLLLNATLERAAFEKSHWEKHFKNLIVDDYQDPQLRRQVEHFKILGDAILEQDKLTELTNAITTMTNIYSTAKICPFEKQNCDLKTEGLSLDPEITQILSKSTDFDELAYIWIAWRNASGAKMRKHYQTYVRLSNEAARANGFKDRGELWREDYETPNFIENIDNLWSQIEPLYLEVYEYVGNKLKDRYGDALDVSDGLLPAHIFGNMWAQEWGNLADLVKPFPNASKLDVDSALRQHNYTVLKMFEAADEFYQSMGLIPNGICYDTSKGAMIEKPTDDGREVMCHPSAYDFCDGKNFKIKMCTKITYEDFKTIHHEMGHIQYFMQYKNLPIQFRAGANPGFHEAVGDTIALSVSTPKHLKTIGLLGNYQHNNESTLNELMDMSLQKVALLPFSLLVDKWRWDVFSGTVQPAEWNAHWWEYRKKYQKLKPPAARSNESDFDPGAKFHVSMDYPYIAYFVAQILQFQLYKGLCIAAGQYNPSNKDVPLNSCDFYRSKTAGAKLSAGLSLGSSHHWSDALEAITGERELNASALLEYFDPLYKYLKKYNDDQNAKSPGRFHATERSTENTQSSIHRNIPLSLLTLALIFELTI